MVHQLFSAEMPSTPQSEEYIEEVETEEVVNFAEIMPMTGIYRSPTRFY
jgi:hypothetical protein